MKRRLDWIRAVIEDVSKRTGRLPVSESTAPTGIMTVPGKTPVAPAPPTGIMPVPGRPTPAAPAPSTGIMPVPGAPKPPAPPDTSAVPVASSPSVARSVPSSPQAESKGNEPDLPPYLGNVFKNLALLSSAPEKFEA
jgi:hypothetical protein